MIKKTLGGDRLGTGNKNKVSMHGYERSTHNLDFVWKSTMASGTIVPFMSKVGLSGDTWDIKLRSEVLTHPTIGPLFGSYKAQYDVFVAPLRLYIAELYNNELEIGMNMSNVFLPAMELQANIPDEFFDINNSQVNPSCIMKYLGISGLGMPETNFLYNTMRRGYNAVPHLAYWDIYKTYYSNKQEEYGAVIHNPLIAITALLDTVFLHDINGVHGLQFQNTPPVGAQAFQAFLNPTSFLEIVWTPYEEIDLDRINIWWRGRFVKPEDIFYTWVWNEVTSTLTGTDPITGNGGIFERTGEMGAIWVNDAIISGNTAEIQIKTFPLKNIDDMRKKLMRWATPGTPFIYGQGEMEPYGLPFHSVQRGTTGFFDFSLTSNQEGLALKTYQSDIYQNWMKTENIDGINGINELTKIDTSSGSFTINEFLINKKVYDMLNRIAVSDGTYEDWLEVTYDHIIQRSLRNPWYAGGMSKEIVFQEVVSNSATTSPDGLQQPLGTLAGRGKFNGKNKGGDIIIKIDEPSYIMGMVSLTPRIDYSQGIEWDMNIRTMNDYHKPAMDGIGFQDLITEQFAWWDTTIYDGVADVKKSAGKTPAWINYMTSVNRNFGNFAIESEQMFMVLDRKYEYVKDPLTNEYSIKDLTTYIDPKKYNNIFAYTRRDAQNFWMQIAIDCTVRRKMSGAIMPNL